MPTYTAEFHTDAEWALLDIKAATPEKALQKARAVDPDTLDFQSYGDRQPVNYITIRDQNSNDLAEWQDDDLRVQLAAREMLEALELCENVLSTLAELDRGALSVSALKIARSAIAKAKDGAP
jgi:hypothetical protein